MGKKLPTVLWAQRSGAIFLTIAVPDVDKDTAKITLESKKMVFSGTSKTTGDEYELECVLFDEIDPESEDSKYRVKDRNVAFYLVKKEEKWWDRILENKALQKTNFKVDFDKWADEDEEEEEGDFNTQGMEGMGGMMGGMGGGMGGMPGMGGMGGMPGMGGMGGMPGMGGAGGPGGMDMNALMAQMAQMQGGEGGAGGMPGMPDMSAMGGAPGGVDFEEADSDDEDDLPDLETEEGDADCVD